MVNNTKKIKHSKRKYGRTRRQRRKQRRMRGGFEFVDLINVFKPKTQEEKCAEAQQEAEKICKPPVLEEEQGLEPVVDSEQQEEQEEPLFKTAPAPFISDEMGSPPLNEMGSPPLNEMVSTLPSNEIGSTLPSNEIGSNPPPPDTMNARSFEGGKKSKKNKKQNRRKKMKTRRNKK